MNNKFMLAAIEESKKACMYDEVPIGAVIVKNKKIIAKAYNTKEKDNFVCSHAEIKAIEQASRILNNWRLDECDIYITLEPCPMCASAIKQARVNKVFFGIRNSDYNNMAIIKKIFEQDKNNKKVMMYGGYYKDKIRKILKDFFYAKRVK